MRWLAALWYVVQPAVGVGLIVGVAGVADGVAVTDGTALADADG
jgi:hypothetical protein